MARQEACQLYIEQEIQDGLAQGKTPYSIGKELAAWVEKLFETSIPADTIRKRAERTQDKLGTNVHTSSTPSHSSEFPQKQEIQEVSPAKRPGPGRAAKYAGPFVAAMLSADIAIKQLSMISDDDPKRGKALEKVEKWINKNKKGVG